MELKSHEFFSFFEPAVADQLQKAATVEAYPPRTIVFEEGEPSDRIYLVLSGLVELCKRADRKTYLTIAYGVENDFFGELGVLDGSARSTRAITVEHATLAEVPKEMVLAALRQATGQTAIDVFNCTIQHLRATDERYVAEVLRKEKMALVGEMAGTIIHDLKNPFHGVSMASGLIRELHPDDKTQRWCGIIDQQVRQMSAMVEELLEFSRGKHELNLQTVSVAGLMEKFSCLHQDYLQKQMIELDLQPLEVPVKADSDKLLRVLQNLVYNAAEALGSKGGRVSIAVQAANGMVEICVSDNGPGIPEEIRDSLFEPFVTSGKRGGTGLGLAIAKSIVEAHGGSICCESMPGEGTVFRIRLPG